MTIAIAVNNQSTVANSLISFILCIELFIQKEKPERDFEDNKCSISVLQNPSLPKDW